MGNAYVGEGSLDQCETARLVGSTQLAVRSLGDCKVPSGVTGGEVRCTEGACEALGRELPNGLEQGISRAAIRSDRS